MLRGESAASDANGAATWASSALPDIMKDYSPSNIYNADDTGFFYELLPAKTLYMKGQPCSGRRHSKKRDCAFLYEHGWLGQALPARHRQEREASML